MAAPVPEVVERRDPWAEAEFLNRDHYLDVASVEPGQPLVLTEPVTVTLDLAALAATTRPPS